MHFFPLAFSLLLTKSPSLHLWLRKVTLTETCLRTIGLWPTCHFFPKSYRRQRHVKEWTMWTAIIIIINITTVQKLSSQLKMISSSSNKAVFMDLFDMSAAFDTVDHDILLGRFQSKFGIKHMVKSWFPPSPKIVLPKCRLTMVSLITVFWDIPCHMDQSSALPSLYFVLPLLAICCVLFILFLTLTTVCQVWSQIWRWLWMCARRAVFLYWCHQWVDDSKYALFKPGQDKVLSY